MLCHSVPCRRIDSLPARCPCTYFQFVSFSCFLLLFAFFVLVKVKKKTISFISPVSHRNSLCIALRASSCFIFFYSFLFASSSLSPLWIGCSFICSSSAYFFFFFSVFFFVFSVLRNRFVFCFLCMCVRVCVIVCTVIGYSSFIIFRVVEDVNVSIFIFIFLLFTTTTRTPHTHTQPDSFGVPY